MSTIKIDRGFTQKIHDHPVTSPNHPHQPPPKKKSPGSQMWLVFAILGVVVLAAVIIVVVVVLSGSKKPVAKPAVPASVSQPVQQTAQQPAAQPPGVEKPEASEPTPEEIMAQYEKNRQKAPDQPQDKTTASSQQTGSRASKRTIREVPLGSPHGLLCEYYEGVKGVTAADLRKAACFPNNPSRTVQIGKFELSEGLGENYGARVRGYLVPPKTGTYSFVVNVDDAGELWLSTDDNPANIRKLVTLTTHTKKKWSDRPEQESAPCELVEGKRYYLEALMKQSSQGDYFAIGWKGLESEKILIIDAKYLIPWTNTSAPSQVGTAPVDEASRSAAERRMAREAREAALAPARAAVAEQQKVNGAANRFAEAAQTLKAGKATWINPDALAIIETAIQKFELLGRLRAFVQAELARSPVKGVWVAFGGQADVTGASDEGVTVAPGRIVAWAKIPPDQMLRLVNATLPKATVNINAKASLFLAGAVFCKDITGGVELALKYRERAVALSAPLASLADRVLGGTPEAILAQPRVKALSEELGKEAKTVAALAEKRFKLQSDFSSITSFVAGLNVEYWENVTGKTLEEVRKQEILTKNSPDSIQHINDFATPEGRGDKYVARVTGYLKPQVTGEYLFYIVADDQGEFWLSSDESADKAAICVKTDSPTGRRQWDKDKRKSQPVSLVKEHRYFVMGLMREGSGGDHMAVAWSPAAENNPALLTSEYLLCHPRAGLSAAAHEFRKQIEEDLLSVQTLAKEIVKLSEAEEIRTDSLSSETTQLANDLQKQVERAKEIQRDVENALKRIETALPQLKKALSSAKE